MDGPRSYQIAVTEAAGLRSEDKENGEYDRALAELIARMWARPGVTTDDRAAEVASDIDAEFTAQRS